jgi:hypothetical protein
MAKFFRVVAATVLQTLGGFALKYLTTVGFRLQTAIVHLDYPPKANHSLDAACRKGAASGSPMNMPCPGIATLFQ